MCWTRDQKRFTVSEMAADWHVQPVQRRMMKMTDQIAGPVLHIQVFFRIFMLLFFRGLSCLGFANSASPLA